MSLCLICQTNELEQQQQEEAQISSVSGVSLALAHSWLELKCYACVCVCVCEAIKAFIQVRVGLDKRPHSNAHQMITQLSGDHSAHPFGNILAQIPHWQHILVHAIYDSRRTQEMSCLPTGDTFHILQHVAELRIHFTIE